ncbi:MAG: HEAT repeat domain-containing protein [Desulfohalobiaceae bacterium]
MEKFTLLAIAVLASLNILTALNIFLIRLRNDRVGQKMVSLEKSYDALINEARLGEVDTNKVRGLLSRRHYPYFQRYLRKRISGTYGPDPSVERRIASLSGFSNHLRDRTLKSAGWKKALDLRTLSYLRDKENIPAFRQILRTENHFPCLLAASYGLALCGDTRSLQLIADKVFDRKRPNRDQLLAVLHSFGPEAAPEIHTFIDEEFLPEDKATVLVDLLALYRYRPAGPTLERIVQRTASPELKIHAVEALGLIGHEESIEILQLLLEDEDFRVRLKTVRSLALLDGERNRAKLKAMLEDDNEWVRLNAAEAMLENLKTGEKVLRDFSDSDSARAGHIARLVLLDNDFNRKRWRYKHEAFAS